MNRGNPRYHSPDHFKVFVYLNMLNRNFRSKNDKELEANERIKRKKRPKKN